MRRYQSEPHKATAKPANRHIINKVSISIMYSFLLVQSMTFSNNNIVDALMMIQMILKLIINGLNIV